MPKTPEMTMNYESMLDTLAEDYPELSKEVDALSAKLADMDMGMEEEALEEEPMTPGDEDIPPELLDEEPEEEEDEEEYTL